MLYFKNNSRIHYSVVVNAQKVGQMLTKVTFNSGEITAVAEETARCFDPTYFEMLQSEGVLVQVSSNAVPKPKLYKVPPKVPKITKA